MNKMTSKERSNWVAKSGILAGAAILLMFFETPLPLMPAFLKFDLSEIPVMLAAFALGPVSAVIIEFIKNLAHLPFTGTGGVGEIANFFVGCALVVPAAVIYRRHKTKRTAILGMAAGTIVMTVFASLINYFVMIPFYIKVMEFPIEAIIGMTAEAGNKLVSDLKTLIIFVFVPFNIFKGLVVSVLVAFIYKPLSTLLHPHVCTPIKEEKSES
ncbi:MAG: ECF transporter S component [Saccharofermentanales bacterium]